MSMKSAMSLRRVRIAALAIVPLALCAAGGTAASASTAAGNAVPATSTRSCGSSGVWLRLWGSSGEHCYTGDGSLVVSLTGVSKEQILGRHDACLTSGTRRSCLAGPASVAISPPVTVTGITLSS